MWTTISDLIAHITPMVSTWWLCAPEPTPVRDRSFALRVVHVRRTAMVLAAGLEVRAQPAVPAVGSDGTLGGVAACRHLLKRIPNPE